MEFKSICCFAAITMQDSNGHGKCSDCGENTTPILGEDLSNPFAFNPLWLILLSFFLLFTSCVSWENLEESNCRGYRLPISSPFFKTSYDLGRREIYAVTDIPLARNKAHYLEHFETCETVQVSSIRKEGDDYYMTFILTEEQFECYKINLNEANITYCSRYK